ncbi:phage minor head protein [Escherichia coli]|uniref:phage minor head protein n=1 Tax=Escherichia coli TaxID=562 RepID=UPI0013B3909F|nr:phage minor head protein [Escherichia coli]
MSINDDIANEVRTHSVNLLRVSASLRKPILDELMKLQKKIVADLMSVEFGKQTATKQKRTKELFDLVTNTIRDAYKEINDIHTKQLRELAEIEATFSSKLLTTNIPVEVATVALTAEQIASVASEALIEGAPSAEWWSRQGGDTLSRFKDTVRQGILAGDTNAEIVQRIVGATKRDGTVVTGFMDTTRRNADALVRTSVQAVANKTRIDTLQANKRVVKALIQVSTLDSRTTTICAARSGLQWDIETLEPIGHSVPFRSGPPYHIGCRSTISPVTRSFRELGIDIDEVPRTTRASLDGEVPADLSFDQFLKNKGEAFQNDLLGKGKADLWRKGNITLTQLLDMTGQPLTLTQLREKYTN